MLMIERWKAAAAAMSKPGVPINPVLIESTVQAIRATRAQRHEPEVNLSAAT